ncbi:MAG: HIT family protein [Deltaproteobacteria bacterium]|nr:HIT family protein [Deltaproteobacteria bacterium]
MANCPFCELPAERIVAQGETLVAVRDHHPVNEGHTLIIPKRHLESPFEYTEAEWSEMRTMLQDIQRRLADEFNPDGFNVGMNVGDSAGQNVAHTYVHVIPRYEGDHPAPQGGVRHVIPHRR